MKLILSQQIQDELEDVDDEEKELQERGKQIEETIRKQAPGIYKITNDSKPLSCNSRERQCDPLRCLQNAGLRC